MKLYYSYMRRLCAYITDRLYQFKRFLQLSIDGLGLSCPVFTKVSGILPVALVCFQFVCLAQESPAGREATGVGEIKPLQIGDSIPEELWSLPLQMINHPDGKDTIALNDYRNKKLIILDFWATWCTSCFASMPRLKELADQYRDNLAIIPVTGESRSKVATFLSASSLLSGLDVTSIVEDTTLRTVFPSRFIPHFVWIKNTGEVVALTTHGQVIGANITNILKNTPASIRMTNEIDVSKPLFLSDAIELGELTHYSIYSRHKFDGIGAGSQFRYQDSILRGRAFTNSSILQMYQMTAYQIFKKIGDRYSDRRLLILLPDTLTIFERDRIPEEMKAVSNNYELVLPLDLTDSLYYYVLRDLNRYTGYIGTVEKKYEKVLVLSAVRDLSHLKNKGDRGKLTFLSEHDRWSIYNTPISTILGLLDMERFIPYPIVDETDYPERIDLHISKIDNVRALDRELSKAGLRLTEEYREINRFVIRRKKSLKTL